MRGVIAAVVLLAGCAGAPFSYVAHEPGPGAGGPYGGDGTIDLVVAYFSFTLDAEEAHGDMGAHCGFDDWTLDPPTARVHTGGPASPRQVVMREIHPDQSTEGVANFGTSPYALWRDGHAIPRAFGEGTLGEVVFRDGGASFRGIDIPMERWVLVDTTYQSQGRESWHVTETLHLRYFAGVPVDFDRARHMCA